MARGYATCSRLRSEYLGKGMPMTGERLTAVKSRTAAEFRKIPAVTGVGLGGGNGTDAALASS